MHILNQTEFFLQQEVRRSNLLQQSLVPVFYADGTNLSKAQEVIKVCKENLVKAKTSPDAAKSTVDGPAKLPNYSSTSFEDEMIKVIAKAFPSLQTGMSKPATSPTAPKIDDLTEVEQVLGIFNEYYTTVHVPQEQRLIRVRTQCQQKFHTLKWITKQREMLGREQSELDWIMSEMKRAINRLTKEGVPMAPGEREPVKSKAATKSVSGSAKPNNVDQPIAVRAHRATWSEASDVIFRLNFNRYEQYERTQELESALKSREVLRSWWEEFSANNGYKRPDPSVLRAEPTSAAASLKE